MLEKDDFLGDLRAHIAKHYITQTAAAEAWGMSRAYLSEIVRGNKPPSQKILDEVGYTRDKIEIYARV